MFDDVGERLGKVAMAFIIIVTIASVIGTLVLISYELTLIAIIVLFAGPGFAYVLALPMLALSEVHMSNKQILEDLRRVSKKVSAIEDRVMNREGRSTNGKAPRGEVKEDGCWTCTCGKNNQSYVTSCVCGVSKRDLNLNK